MAFNRVIVDLNHIFDHESFTETGNFNQDKIIFVKKKSNNNLFFLIKKDEGLFKHGKKSFINKSEKSFALIHTSVINISGFSIEKPYLYYKFLNNPRNINDIELLDENIQKMFLGIASGLSYLLSKGYSYSNFSINSIVFDEKDCPKLLDYINFDNSNLMDENDLIISYIDIFNFVMHKKKKKNPKTNINDELKSLIERVSRRENTLSFQNFIDFFRNTSYCTNIDVFKKASFIKYLDILEYADIVVKDNDAYLSNKENREITNFCFSLYDSGGCIGIEDKANLNSVPEYYIRPLSGIISGFEKSMMKFLYVEKFSITKENFSQQKNDKDFTFYCQLMEEIKNLEDKRIKEIYIKKERKKLESKIEKIRIQAIYYLKKAADNPNSAQAKIELAIQYIKGLILPYNLTKSLDILNSITSSDDQTVDLINQMKKNLKEEIQSMSIDNLLQNLPPKGKKLLQEAEKGNILSMLFVGFAFYTGFNKFPVLRSLSIYYFRAAAKKSPYAMYHLGYLYFIGLIFPKNFKRAQSCFKRAADGSYIKAEILDGFLRKHLCRSYLLNFKMNNFISNYRPTFRSMFPNDAYVFPRINYFLESNLHSDKLILIELKEDENEANYENEINNMFLVQNTFDVNDLSNYQRIKHGYSKKVVLSLDDSNENNLSKEDLCAKAKNFFNGENNHPVNYSIALDYFKLAADKGDSEAQWRYAMMVENSLGTKKDQKIVLKYFHESAKQNNIRGKFLYALLLKSNDNINLFEQLINECCDSECLDAMYFYGLYLEKIDKKLERPMYYYKKAADNGHLDSLVRLIYILKSKSQKKLYEKYLNLSVSLFNESLLIKLINFYDRNKKYDQSNILIEIGIKLNYEIFGAFLADHLLYGKGMAINVERAKKIVFLTYKYVEKKKYLERYHFIILDILILNNEHDKAVAFLIKNEADFSSKYRSKFLLIYSKLNKNIARDYYITINFCYEQYRDCHSKLMELKDSHNKNFLTIYDNLYDLARFHNNPYAMVILGKLYKNGQHVMRNLKTAVQFFVWAAKQKCPEGYYYLGKEYYYGRVLNQSFKKANMLFIKALKNNREPRAGYYLYKIETIYIKDDDDDDVLIKGESSDDEKKEEEDEENVDAVKSLIIAANFDYKKALYKYGHRLVTGRDPRISMDVPKGEDLISRAASQYHKKAIRYCKMHNISYDKKEKNSKLLHNKENKKHSLDRSSDEDESNSISDILNINENDLNGSGKDIIRQDLNNLYEGGKNSILSNEKEDKKKSDSDSSDISELKFWS